jgi:hypothetical protein
MLKCHGLTDTIKVITIWTFLWLLLFTIALPSSAQVGGRHVYEFLELSNSARLSALGEHQIAVSDLDLSLAARNPAVLADTMHGRISINHRFYFDGINHGYFAYASKLPYWDLNLHAGIQYIQYGEFTAADIFGNITGSFTGGEQAILVGASKKLMDRLSVGINTKWIQSRFESYNSYGMAIDLGAFYTLKDGFTGMGFVVKNIGTQFSSYADIREPLPFDVQLGLARRLEHLPFRFTITAHNLHRWNIIYDDPNQENNSILIGEETAPSKVSIFTDNLFRHLVFSGEFLIGKSESFSLRFAYNHLRRKELSVLNFISLNGFSFGAGIKFSHFQLDYAYNVFHLAGGSSHLGFSMDINRVFRKF